MRIAPYILIQSESQVLTQKKCRKFSQRFRELLRREPLTLFMEGKRFFGFYGPGLDLDSDEFCLWNIRFSADAD